MVDFTEFIIGRKGHLTPNTITIAFDLKFSSNQWTHH